MIKWKGNATAKLLVDEFKTTYPRRSALLDELQKIEKKLISVSWLLHLVLLFYCCFGKWLCSAGSDADALFYKVPVQVKIFLVIYPNGFYYKIVVGK